MWDSIYPVVLPILASATFYALYRFFWIIYGVLLYKLTVSLTITTDDASTWTYLQSYIKRHLERSARDFVMGPTDVSLIAGHIPTPVTIWFEGKPVRLRITETLPTQMTLVQSSNNGSRLIRRTASLWTRYGDGEFFKRFLAMLKREHLTQTADKVEFCLPELNVHTGYANWWAYKYIQRRTFASLTLDPMIESSLLTDLERFMRPEARIFYKTHGIPYRRGWLFYGSPGNGKSSAIVATASLLGSSVRRLSLQGLDDSALTKLMTGSSDDDPPVLLLFEDIDCLFVDREKVPDAPKTNVTFSGLLNALDGVGSPENAIIIMTTNYRERLDKALLRPGRVDKEFHFSPPDNMRIATHYKKFFPSAGRLDEETLAFVARCLSDKNCSMATVQGKILEELAKQNNIVSRDLFQKNE